MVSLHPTNAIEQIAINHEDYIIRYKKKDKLSELHHIPRQCGGKFEYRIIYLIHQSIIAITLCHSYKHYTSLVIVY